MFGGFRATMNLFGGKKNKKDRNSEISQYSMTGAYRTSRDDSFGYNNSFDQTKRTTSEALQQIRPTKSTSDLTKAKNSAVKTRNSIPEVSRDPRGAEQLVLRNGSETNTKNQDKEQKRLEKQRLAEQKVIEKQAAQEQAKQDKLRKERERKEAEKQKRERKPEKKRQAPKPQAPQPASTASHHPQYSTNTLGSSISRSSGPPPYSEVPNPIGVPQKATDKSRNITYSKPVDTGSWDMISQHREQMIRPTTTIGSGKQSKQMVMDLNYNFGATTSQKDNSDA